MFELRQTPVLKLAGKILGLIGLTLAIYVPFVSFVADFHGAATVDMNTTTAMLSRECGLHWDGSPAGKPHSVTCPATIRKFVRESGLRINIGAEVANFSRGRVCVGGLLEMSDDELVAVYSRWASREEYDFAVRLSAEVMINSVLEKHFRCPGY